MSKTRALLAGAAAVPVLVAGLWVGGDPLLQALHRWERPAHEKDGASVVYADKLAGGLPTVCGGHTDWSLRVGTAYSKADCEKIDRANSAKYALAIIACSGHTEARPVLNQHMLDALTLFAINVGTAGACDSRAMRLMRGGKADEGCRAIANAPDGRPVWSYVNKTTFVRGLYDRRRFERDWCLKPMPTTGRAAA